MELGYDSEELGYEEGYGRVSSRYFTSQKKWVYEEESALFGYQCEPPAGSPSVLNRTPTVFPTVGGPNTPAGNKPITPGIVPPSIPTFSPGAPVKPAGVLKLVQGGQNEAKTNPAPVNGTSRVSSSGTSPSTSNQLIKLEGRKETLRIPDASEIKIFTFPAELELKDQLSNKGLKPAEVEAYMKKFDGSDDKKREKDIKANIVYVQRPDVKREDILKKIQPSVSQTNPTRSAPPSVPASSTTSGYKELNGMINNLPSPLRSKAVEYSRSTLFYTLTGQQFDKSHPIKIPEGTKPMDPPLTRGEAMAYMQSQGLTDGQGNPTKEADSKVFLDADIKVHRGDLDRKSIVDWERKEIVNTLSGPPYKMKGQEIVRFMNSKNNGWLGDNPNLELMESFRQRAASGKEVAAIKSEVKAAYVKGNDIITEGAGKDRADQILDNLGPKKKGKEAALAAQTREARAGRNLQRSEGQAQRDTNLKVATMKEEGDMRRQQESIKAQKEENDAKRAFDDKQSAKQRKHDADQREKDRKSQLVNALISFIGQMISSALQAMSGVVGQVIGSLGGLSNQTIGSIKHGKGS